MTIRYNEYGEPYDDGEYDYGSSFTEALPQEQPVYQEGDGGSYDGGEYNYGQEVQQQSPSVVMDDPAIVMDSYNDQLSLPPDSSAITDVPLDDPYANEPTDFSYQEPVDFYSSLGNPDLLFPSKNLGASPSGQLTYGFGGGGSGKGAGSSMTIGSTPTYSPMPNAFDAAGIEKYNYTPASIQGPPSELQGSANDLAVAPIVVASADQNAIPKVESQPSQSPLLPNDQSNLLSPREKTEQQLRKQITEKENFDRDMKIYYDFSYSDQERKQAGQRIDNYRAEQTKKKHAEEEANHLESINKKVQDALYRSDVSKSSPAVGGPAAGVLASSGEVTSDESVPVTPAKPSKPSAPLSVYDESSERKDVNSFLVKDSKGQLVPEIIPLASDIFDKKTAEKALLKVRSLKQAELDSMLPKGKLLERELRLRQIRDGLDDAGMQRIYDVVTEVHKKNDMSTHNDRSGSSGQSDGVVKDSGSSNSFKSKDGEASSNFTSGIKTSLGKEENSKSGSGETRSTGSGESVRSSSTDNRMALAGLKSNLEKSIAESILARSNEIRAQVGGKYDAEIEKYNARYNQLDVDSAAKISTWLNDVTGAGSSYPKRAAATQSLAVAPNIEHFSKRFDTNDPILKQDVKDISVKHGLFDLGPEKFNESKPIDGLSNPKIAGILDGKFHNKIIDDIIKGSNPDLEYEKAKALYLGEKIRREEVAPVYDPNDKDAETKRVAFLKSSATNTDFGQAVLAAKVLKAHSDIVQSFTMPSPNPADADNPRKRVVVPFPKFLENLYQEVSSDPTSNAIKGAVGMEIANRIPEYRKELTKLDQATKSTFYDSNKIAMAYMARFLADPSNGKYYQTKIMKYAPEKYGGQKLSSPERRYEKSDFENWLKSKGIE